MDIVISNLPDLISGKGADLDIINSIEKKLDLHFSKEYKYYLNHYGMISFDGRELSGIGPVQHMNVDILTFDEWSYNPYVPHNLYVIESIGVESIIIWQDEQGIIYESSPNHKPNKIANSLCEYLSNNI